jgi:hypothetical protein
VPPCTDWISGDDVADCCSVEVSSGALFDVVASKASEILFELSGRQFAGLCEKTVRPCRTNCNCMWQILSRGHIIGPWDWGYGPYGGYWMCDSSPCGCVPLSRVKLSGYPVQEVTEVKVNGAVVPATEYRLDEQRYVTAVRALSTDDANSWPGCQNLDLPDTQEGTWSITYTYGQEPPEIGIEAAAQLACELYKACNGESCALPKGTTRVTRQGVTIEKLAFSAWAWVPARSARSGRAPGWQTGLPLVDAFLAAYNPAGLMRRPVFWAPSITHRYARPVG